MQFVEFLYFLKKTRTIICNSWYFFPFSKNVDYHMQFLKFLSILQKRGLSLAILEFLSHLQKHGQSYAISRISFSSPKTWNLICNISNFFPFTKRVYKHMEFRKFISLLQKRGLSYAIS